MTSVASATAVTIMTAVSTISAPAVIPISVSVSSSFVSSTTSMMMRIFMCRVVLAWIIGSSRLVPRFGCAEGLVAQWIEIIQSMLIV
eukprot:CAMPEP_0203677684 /NCGR_PEP_ID=MMETSP0090-20130426/29103_1 /ASSEMBLY_ACC=CAM_ASM_001088 /TAXON_ID=426623 /ORGANISM="Chaetoceros affinis, Strain CCMP159" /LENGTH=86 /DNA_ID=CAMNT_0050544651 /DNA_START=120 /DNA_END=380 /DNA_ORIENTATION=-